jgi:hypothetical protein
MLTGISTNRKNRIDTKLNKTEYIPMIANWQYGEEGRWWQMERCNCCRVGDAHSTDFLSPFLSRYIRFFFLTLTSKALRVLYLLDNDAKRPSSPNLYTTAWHVLRKDLRDLRVTVLSFCRSDVAGDGSTTTNIKMNTKWLFNTSRSYPTSTWHVLRNDLRDLRMRMQVDVAGTGCNKVKVFFGVPSIFIVSHLGEMKNGRFFLVF